MAKDPRKGASSSDYCILGDSDEYRLSRFERLTLVGGDELEKALVWMARQLASFTYMDKLGPVSVPELLAAGAHYRATIAAGSCENYFKTPTEAPEITIHPVHGLMDGSIVDLVFPSCYEAQHKDYQDEYSEFITNQYVHARMWKHHEKAPATVIAIHGWTMGDQRINSLAFQPGFFYQLGLDIILLELPYHGRRSPDKEKHGESGSLFPSSNVVRTNESMAQAISDLRQLTMWLQLQGVETYGCLGMSLGGYVSALWASLDSLSFCIPIVPMSSMQELAWEALTRHPDFDDLEAQGLTRALMDDLYFMHSPLQMTPKIDPDRALIIAGIGDKIIPARQPKMLWDHWNRPKMHWFKGGHLAQLKRSTAFDAMHDFLHSLGYVEAR